MPIPNSNAGDPFPHTESIAAPRTNGAWRYNAQFVSTIDTGGLNTVIELLAGIDQKLTQLIEIFNPDKLQG